MFKVRMIAVFTILILITFVSADEVDWNGNNWALWCDFNGNNLSNTVTKPDDCEARCAATSECTHYTWTISNGGTCQMKNGLVSNKDAVVRYSAKARCGIIGKASEEVAPASEASIVSNPVQNLSSAIHSHTHYGDVIVERKLEFVNSVTCSQYQWKCDNGEECIDLDELCDGIQHCADKSDETPRSCFRNRCPNYAFRCSYGACVDSDSECNNVKNCIDNSDEESLKCPGVLESYDVKGTCTAGSFQCKIGECISEDKVCDGKIHCSNRNDETPDRCASSYCPLSGFRCGYGACVHQSAKCDGTVDCADNSDETSELCVVPVSAANLTTVISGDPGSCLIPLDIQDSLGVFYEDDNSTEIPKGSYADPSSSIIYDCKGIYMLERNTSNTCIDGEWISQHPSCLKYCSLLPLSGVTKRVTCELFDAIVPCNEILQPKTIVKISCAPGYQNSKNITDFVRCSDTGEWEYPPDYQAFKCEQICGIKAPDDIAHRISGGIETATVTPWHVAIYSNLTIKPGFHHICGGSIINAKVIISAAHCFWNRTKFYEPQNYKIGAGKIFREFNAIEHTVQFADVAQILRYKQYLDSEGNYNSDIALLTLLNHLQFNSYVTPICLETNLSFYERDVPNGTYGQVVGWGLVTSGGKNSDVLKSISLPAVDLDECKTKLRKQLHPILTYDKFCAGIAMSGNNVCAGDSGGGFVYSKVVDGRKLFHLSGLVSSSGNYDDDCDNRGYSVFTNILHHIEFIKGVESKYVPK